jgi:hypothetical protein
MSGCAATRAGDGAVDGARSALIVASDEYADPGLRRLRAPAADARALAAVLRDPGIGGFEVRTLLNAPAHEVSLAVEEFFADRRPDDLLLVHFSCHGVKDEAGELYFAASNTLLGRLGATAVAAEFVNRRMSRSRSRRVVLLLDCCYAGAFERGMTARAGAEIGVESQFGGRGRAVITASSAMEYAFEGDELADARELAPSVFTSALVQGLETGEADRDQDGLVALDELYDYIYDKVRAVTPNQTPGKWTFGIQGELVIARRARPVTTPAPLPRELQEAIDSPFAAVRAAAVQELARLLSSRHAGLALAARLALERLTGDDSRTVATAATAAVGAPALSALPEPAPPKAAPPELALSAAVVDFGRLALDSESPERRVRLGNAGGGSLNPRAATSVSWLKLRLEGDELVVSADTTAAVEHEGTITIDSDGGSATIRVKARVEPPPPVPAAAAATHRDTAPEMPEGAQGGAQQDAAFPVASPALTSAGPPVVAPALTPTAAGEAVAGPAAEPSLPPGAADRGVASQARADRRLLVAGELAIVGAALLVVGLFPAYEWTDSLWKGRPDRDDMRWYALYVIILAALVLGAGICTLIPRTRRWIGPGLMLGVVAASTWGLLFLATDRLRFGGGTYFGGGWWFELIAHMVLVLAACLAALALARTTEIRLMHRLPESQLPWLVVLLGGAGAVALLFHDLNLWHPSWLPARWYVAPSIWVTVMAVVVPACAAVTLPRRLGVTLLAGWVAGGAAVFWFLYSWDRYQENGNIDTNPIIVFGFTLLALLIATVLFARAAPNSQSAK